MSNLGIGSSTTLTSGSGHSQVFFTSANVRSTADLPLSGWQQISHLGPLTHSFQQKKQQFQTSWFPLLRNYPSGIMVKVKMMLRRFADHTRRGWQFLHPGSVELSWTIMNYQVGHRCFPKSSSSRPLHNDGHPILLVGLSRFCGVRIQKKTQVA